MCKKIGFFLHRILGFDGSSTIDAEGRICAKKKVFFLHRLLGFEIF